MASLNRQTIDAEHYVARYVLGRLSESEVEAFEEFCLLDPEIAEQVSTDRALREGLKSIGATPARPGIAKWVRYSLAAGLVAAFAIGFSQYGLHTSAEVPGRLFADAANVPEALNIPRGEGIRIVGTRSSPTPIVTLERDTRAIEILVTPGATAGGTLPKVILHQEVGDGWQVIGTLSEVSANEDGDLSLLVDVRDLAATRMRLTLQGTDGATDEFEFRVTRAAN